MTTSYATMPVFPVVYPVKICIDLFLPFLPTDKRKHDLDNYIKGILDACNNIIWVDDTQVWYIRARRYFDKENPRVNVEIEWD